jgi:hypothetical protein
MWKLFAGIIIGVAAANKHHDYYYKNIYARQKQENSRYFSFILKKKLQDEFREYKETEPKN